VPIIAFVVCPSSSIPAEKLVSFTYQYVVTFLVFYISKIHDTVRLRLATTATGGRPQMQGEVVGQDVRGDLHEIDNSPTTTYYVDIRNSLKLKQ
jgi:hypothetical protein